MDYYELRKAVARLVPRRNVFESIEAQASIKEKGRKKNYHQFNLFQREWVKSERLLNEEEFKNFIEISLRASACPMPLNADVWDGLLCGYGCKYCFADAFRATLYTAFFDNSKTMGLRSADPAFFLPELDKYFSGKGNGDIQQAIKQRIPIRVGIRFEDFLPIERKRGAALALLNHLKNNNYPIMINSKSDLIAREPYLSALADNKAKAAVHVTLITADNAMLRRIEPGAPSYAKRLETMRTLSAAGIRVVARIEPFMVFINDDRAMVEKYIEEVYATGCRNITFDTYSYSANNPGIRSSFYNIGYDFGRMFTLISDSQAIGSLLLGKFMDLFRAKGFSCSTFDLGNVPNNDDEICCEVGNWFTESRFNLGSSVSAIRYIQSREGERVYWKEFERHVNEKGGFLSDELKKSIFETWNMKGNSAYFISWGSGIEAAGEDSAGVTVWRYTDEYDFRERILENCL